MPIINRGFYITCDHDGGSCDEEFDPANGDETNVIEDVETEAQQNGWTVTRTEYFGDCDLWFCPSHTPDKETE